MNHTVAAGIWMQSAFGAVTIAALTPGVPVALHLTRATPKPFPIPTQQPYQPQMPTLESRLRSIRAHDDGVDSWRMADVAPPPLLAGLIHGYSDYAERTGSFTTRRELPHP